MRIDGIIDGGIDGLIFDFGNTLVPWSNRETKRLYGDLKEEYEREFGRAPGFFERALETRDRMLRERENTTLRELTMQEFMAELGNGATTSDLVERATRRMSDSFIEICSVPEGLRGILDALGRDRPLAVLSNFVLTEPVEQVLKRGGLWDCFVHVEVSATRGFMKPHPEPFEIVREALGTPMERTLMVGDDFFADIVGGHRAGMRTALTHQYSLGPIRDDRAPEVSADRVLTDLAELLD